jgi:hypothetical protein
VAVGVEGFPGFGAADDGVLGVVMLWLFLEEPP